MTDKIILASESPRRKELLESVGCDFCVIPPDVKEEEIPYHGSNPEEYAMKLAELKAESVSSENPKTLVLAADTIVVADEEIYGKPKDREQAGEMLRNLSGKRHRVITGVCIIKRDQQVKLLDYRCTDVWFDCLTEEKLQSYLDTGEYADKAGAYGIQEKGALLVEKIEGCFFNVMGLPLNLVESMLNKTGRSLF
ncbi:MAG TPA: hypothetical protein DDZ89_08265 [Clostridiales bacterium]|mgnify:CR=1 FL=1|nr:hypothetical protein [Clostridiales bacterium]